MIIDDKTCVNTPVTCNLSALQQPDISEVKPAWYWIRDARGYGSITVTLVFVSFWVVTIAYILSIFGKIGPITIRPFDFGACSSYLIPILTLYFGRKYSDAKLGVNDKQ